MKTNDQFDLREIIAIFRRQFRLIIVSSAIVMALGMIYVFSATPKYNATALIYIDTSSKDLLSADEGARGSTQAENSQIESEVQILKSNRVLFETLQRTSLITDSEFGPSIGRVGQIKLALGMDVQQPTDPRRCGESCPYRQYSG